jgi:rod shape-determining protein MreD
MSRIAGSDRDVAFWTARRQWVPILSTLAATMLDLMPIIAQRPLVPDFAFLVLISWRLLRPEIWPAHIALPLGLFNDMIAGHPIGQSMAVWTLAFLLLDLIDSRVGWRDYWLDWVFAALLILAHTAAGWYVARLMGSVTLFDVMVPQIVLSIFAYPLVARLIVGLDRWRLAR